MIVKSRFSSVLSGKCYKYVVIIGPSNKTSVSFIDLRVGFASTFERAVKKAEDPKTLHTHSNYSLKDYIIYGIFEIQEKYEPYWQNAKVGKVLKNLSGSKYSESESTKKS